MFTVLALLVTPEAHAMDRDSHPFGLGVVLGQPTGLSGKVYLDRRAQAIDFAVASTPWRGIYGHATYLWHPSVIASSNNLDVEWHVGVGGLVWSPLGYDDNRPWWAEDGNVALGVRVPIGLDFNLVDPRFQFFGDVALAAVALPDPAPGIEANVGARYYF